jgi:hypothetical protein
MELFRRQQGEPFAEVEAHLRSEQGKRARSGAIHLLDTLVENPLHEVEILTHSTTLIGLQAPSSRSLQHY